MAEISLRITEISACGQKKSFRVGSDDSQALTRRTAVVRPRMPGGVTGKAREGQPMSILEPDQILCWPETKVKSLLRSVDVRIIPGRAKPRDLTKSAALLSMREKAVET